MIKKKFALVFLALTLALSACLFVACGKEPAGGNEHKHAYTQWAHDEEQHWKVCSCGNADNSTKANHVFVDGECECGATKIMPSDYERDQENHWLLKEDGSVDTATKAAHTYGTGASCTVCGRYSLKAQVTSVVSAIGNYSLVLENCTFAIDERNVTIEVSALHIGLDESGKLCGWANISAPTDIVLTIDDKGATKNVNLRYGAKVIIANDLVYVTTVTDSAYKFENYAINTVDGYCVLPLGDFMDQTLGNLPNLNISYAQLEETISEFLDKLDGYSETVVALYEYIGSLVTGSSETLAETSGTNSSFISVETDSDGNKTYTVNFAALHSINEFLATTTIGDLLESLAGENYATTIPTLIESAFEITIGDIIDFAKEQTGKSLDELITIANDIIAIVTDDDSITLDALLAQTGIFPTGTTIKALLSDNIVKAYTLEDILAMVQQGAESPITVDYIVGFVANIIDSTKDMSVYELILRSMIMNDEATEPTYGEVIGEMIGEVIDLIDSYVHVTVKVDKLGVMQSASLRFGFDEQITIGKDLTASPLVNNLAKIKGTLSLKRGVAFENANDFISDTKKELKTITDAIAKDLLKDKDTIEKFIKNEFLWADEHEEIVSLAKNADGDWILTIKGYRDESYINYGCWDSIKEAMEWTDAEINGLEYGYVYTATLNLNKDFSILSLRDTACNGKRSGTISAFFKRQITGVYAVGTDQHAYSWKTDPISAEQLAKVIEILEDSSIYAYDWLTSGYLNENTSGQRYIDFIYDGASKSIDVYPENYDVHDWKLATEIDEEDLHCGYYTEITQKCSKCNATRKVYAIKSCSKFEWTEPVLQEDGDCDDGRISYKRCVECGKVDDSRLVYGHTQGEEIAEGNCTSEQGVTYTCTVCGKDFVYNKYKNHYWVIEKVIEEGSATLKWSSCSRCTTGKHWDLYPDTDIGWTVTNMKNGTLYTTPDGVSIAEIDEVYYLGYNQETSSYTYRLDNESGEKIAYADDVAA